MHAHERHPQFATLVTLAWLVGLAYLGFYVYAVVTGLLNPGELVVAGIAAIVIAVLCFIHAARVRRVLQEHNDPSHAEAMRALHAQRERRGF